MVTVETISAECPRCGMPTGDKCSADEEGDLQVIYRMLNVRAAVFSKDISLYRVSLGPQSVRRVYLVS